jgi:uncharacterized membrane protein
MLKTTVLGGVLFLIPFGILLLVLHEVLLLSLVIVDPIASLFPKDDYWGISLALVLAVVLIILVCFLAGLAARHAAVSGVSSKADQFLEQLIPGYEMLRSRIASVFSEEPHASSKKVVSVMSGGLKRYAILIEENAETGDAVVFLPGAPSAESGILGRVQISDLVFEDIPAHKLHSAFKFYGRGLGEIVS